MLSRSIKEAIKVATAVAVSIALALFFQWDKPYWAAVTVIAISANESFGHGIRQGKMRLLGTLMGVLYALVMIALFSQERLMFIAFFHLFLGFCVFFSDNKRYGYAFTMAFTVFAIVAMMGGTNGTASFDVAILRIQETLLGVLVYSGVFRFLWPTTTESLFFDTLETLTQQFALARTRLTQAFSDGQTLDDDAELLANQGNIDRLRELLALSAASHYQLRHEKAKWQSVVQACDGIQGHITQLAEAIASQQRQPHEANHQQPDLEMLALEQPSLAQPDLAETDLDETGLIRQGLDKLSQELDLLAACIDKEQPQSRELARYWAGQSQSNAELNAQVEANAEAKAANKAAQSKLLQQRLTNALTAIAISLTCFSLWIYFAIPGGPIFPLIGAALANVAVHMLGSIIRQAKLACLAWGALFLAEYCFILTTLTELWQLVAFYGINTLLVYGYFNKPSQVVIRLLGGNLLLIMTMNALHGTPQYEIITPLLMLVIMLICLTVVRFYLRLFKK
ncbi:FUSC family protein [Shewanella sp. KCT]|uniref:FUSC family protein n=1 Tax=Shewanella sp. KCT TaxID=2569535 RepID=UPI001183154E|nr:FUSC family protein [Shewanella sp. KCT]TVP14606.1 hypothetical protein AYI87_09500 [Shewanella sp. KCT]